MKIPIGKACNEKMILNIYNENDSSFVNVQKMYKIQTSISCGIIFGEFFEKLKA